MKYFELLNFLTHANLDPTFALDNKGNNMGCLTAYNYKIPHCLRQGVFPRTNKLATSIHY